MDRIPEGLSTVKRCIDCAHYKDEKCLRSKKIDPITGAEGFYSVIAERACASMFGSCGKEAVHFIPSESAQAARSVRRLQRYKAVEDALAELRPDLEEAIELLDALQAAVEQAATNANEDHLLTDVSACFADLREAMEEAQTRIPYEPDQMTLAKQEAEAKL